MKTYANAILMITICTFTFLSCSKKKDVMPPDTTNYGAVVFWTKNAANLGLCRNDINVYLVLGTPFGVAITNNAHIRYILAAAPTYCDNESAIGSIIPGVKYYYTVYNCALGQMFGPIDSFSLSPRECRKIEIP